MTGEKTVKVTLDGGLGRQLQSRPLRTGTSFTLVMHASHLQYVHWDRADYAPGDSCVLSLEGDHLGNEPVEVTVEAEQEDGAWAPVGKAQVQIDPEQSVGTAKWTVPVPPGHAEALGAREAARRGQLVEAAWAEHEVDEGESLAANIRVEGMEGEKLTVIVEREMPDGSWSAVAAGQPVVSGGQCAMPWTPPPEPPTPPKEPGSPPAGELLAGKFEDGADLGDADTAWLKVDCAGMEHQEVQLVLEREEDGGWVEVGSAVSTVKGSEAHAGIGT